MTRMPSKLTCLGAFAILLAGCGGSSHKASTTHTTTHSTTTHTSSGKTPVAPKTAPLAELIQVTKQKSPASPSARAATGDGVEFLTKVPGTPSGPPVKVHLDFSHQSATKWTVTASAKGQKSTATLTSKNGQPLVFGSLRYGCALPPAATFCPARHVVATATDIKAQFSSTPSMPIVVAGLVGPATTAPTAAAPSTLLAPTYTVQTTVLDIPKHKAAGAAPVRLGQTATAHPGDSLILRVSVTGRVVGAPQPVTLNLDQGPAKSLTVSAGVPGGSTSTATITSATGGRIGIVLPHYGCALPPAPTFCPPSSVKAGSHKYTVTFDATPKVPPIVITSVVQGG